MFVEPLWFLIAAVVVLTPFVSVGLLIAFGRRLGAAEESQKRLQGAVQRLERQLAAQEGASAPGRSSREPDADAPSATRAAAVSYEPGPIGAAAVAHEPDTSEPERAAAFPPPIRPAAAGARGVSLESFVGGRVLLVVGVIAVLFALAFFLRIAIDREWIGPPMRIGLGVAAGLALLAVGDRLRHRGLAVFGHGLMGAGLGALYLSTYFAAVRYGFIGRPTAFACVALVTGLGAALAVLRDAPLLAWLGFAGGYLAPALLGQDVDALPQLSGWLCVLHLGLGAVLLRRAWAGLELLAVAASAVYFGAWLDQWFDPAAPWWPVLMLVAHLGVLLAVAGVPSWTRRALLPSPSLAAMGFTGLWVTAAAHEMLFPEHRVALGAGLLGLGALFGLMGWAQVLRRGAREADAVTLGALALAAVAVALPVMHAGRALPPAWAFTGLAAVVLGARRRASVYVVGGLALMLFAALAVLVRHTPLHHEAFVPIFNGAFASAVAPALAALLAARELARSSLPAPVGGIVIAAGLWWLSGFLGMEAWDAVVVGRDVADPAALWALGRSALAATLATCAVLIAVGPGRRMARGAHLPLLPLAVAVLVVLFHGLRAHRAPFTPALNPLFGLGLVVSCAAFAVAGLSDRSWRGVIVVVGLLQLLALVTSELYAWGEWRVLGDGFTREQARFAAQLAVSVAWALYAATLVGLGFARRHAELRWVGLGVFALTVGKVFLFDMERLDMAYRVGAFLALGVLLVGASLLYHRAQRDDVAPG